MSRIVSSVAGEIIKNNLSREYKTLSKYACYVLISAFQVLISRTDILRKQ